MNHGTAHPCLLPNDKTWRFDELRTFDGVIADKLEAAPHPSDLLKAVAETFDLSARAGSVRFGCEEAEIRRSDCRAVLQFGVSSDFFDLFFNGRTGYRAHFRAGADCGLAFNAQIIEAVCDSLKALSPIHAGRRLNSKFEDIGAAQIPTSFLLESLDLCQSKIWVCTKRICLGGGIEALGVGVGGPRNLLDGETAWQVMSREAAVAWLDIKGAFLGPDGRYQPKDPMKRAAKLRDSGTA